MDQVTIKVIDFDGSLNVIEIPTGISLSLMEALKACGYDIQATCGGMALCATCHINVLSGLGNIPPAGDAELEMLDSLPVITAGSRLSCQIRVDTFLEGIELQLMG